MTDFDARRRALERSWPPATPLERADIAALAATTDLVQLGMLASDVRRRRTRRRRHLRPRRRTSHRRAAARRLSGDGRRDPPAGRALDRGSGDRQAWAAVERANGVPVTAWALADLVALAKDLEGLGTLAGRPARSGPGRRRGRAPVDLVEDAAIQWVVDAGLPLPVAARRTTPPAEPAVFLRRVANLHARPARSRPSRRCRARRRRWRRRPATTTSSWWRWRRCSSRAWTASRWTGASTAPSSVRSGSSSAPTISTTSRERRRAARTPPRPARGGAPQHRWRRR